MNLLMILVAFMSLEKHVQKVVRARNADVLDYVYFPCVYSFSFGIHFDLQG